jgi:CRISPR-associated protein Csb2
LRVLQALAAASAGRWNERRRLDEAVPALKWLESLPPPQVVAAEARACTPHRLYVPDNVADKVAASWARGREAAIADYRVEKDVQPLHLEGDTVHYLYALGGGGGEHLETLSAAARSITHVGWGRDMAAGEAKIISAREAGQLAGVRWHPAGQGGTRLRVPRRGTLEELGRRHADFLSRVTETGFRPVAPLRVFDLAGYRREDEAAGRPWRVFELRNADGSRFRYAHRRLIHVAGMVRHLALAAMAKDPPKGVEEGWLESYVAGHAGRGGDHRQFSYLPLPSTGQEHTDPGVRRVMVAAAPGDEAWLDHLVRRLAGAKLEPQRGGEFGGAEPPLLVPLPRQARDRVVRCYTEASSVWHSFTPVILPGHDDHKAEKTRALIERALHQSGIDQACEFEWSPFSRFGKSYPAHPYDRQKRPQGYIRPSYLKGFPAVHVTLRFRGDRQVAGPLAIGAGRHCGLGLMAHLDGARQGE